MWRNNWTVVELAESECAQSDPSVCLLTEREFESDESFNIEKPEHDVRAVLAVRNDATTSREQVAVA